MKTKRQITKNLTHGYIFLISLLLVPFLIALGTEIYLKGGFNINIGQQEAPEEIPEEINDPEPTFKLEIENLQSGYKTKDSSITIVGITEKEALIFVQNEKVEINSESRFERRIDLAFGSNEIIVQAFIGEEKKREIKLEVIREEEQKQPPSEEPSNGGNTPAPQPIPQPQQPTPQPAPTPAPNPPPPQPTPEPQPSPISGIKLSCSITNTYPSVGQSVTINCTVRDQNNNPVSGAFGYVTVNWQSGSSIYNLSQSNGDGAMSVSFNVPAGNSGSIGGEIRASKNGLNVSSNFTLNVQ